MSGEGESEMRLSPSPSVEGPLSPSAMGDGATTTAPVAVDPAVVEALTQFLRHSCPTLLHANIPVFLAALNGFEAQKSLESFVSDSASPTLIVHKRLMRNKRAADEEPEEIYEFEVPSASLSLAATSQSATVIDSTALAFIKSVPTLDLSTPLSSQLYACSLHEPAMFETILSYVRHVFLPFSRSISRAPGEEESKKQTSTAPTDSSNTDVALYRGVARKLGELEVELLRFQESIDIPFITLDLHPRIAAFVQSQQKSNQPLRVEDMGELASDPAFLNEIQRGLNEWKKSISRVTKLSRDVSTGTVLQEINFWLAMERAVLRIYEERDSAGVELTFAVLKQNKRFLATTGFMQDVGLSEEGKDKDRIIRYAAFLRDLPVKRLLAATDLTELNKSLDFIFHHFKQIKRVDYPLSRLIALLQSLSRDIVSQIQSVLHNRHVLSLSYEEFQSLISPSDELFQSWNTKIHEMNEIIRGLHRKKPSESITNLNQPYTELMAMKARLAEIRKLRKEHEELRSVISDTLSNDAYVRATALDAIHAAYARLTARDFDVLSITAEGTESYHTVIQSYNAKIDRVERELETKIREFLDAAKDDSNEMFRVCARFNPLFVRPRIQSAIREYQEQLIMTVKKDISLLQSQFHNVSAKNEARLMSAMHDVPPVAAQILWAKQIERQLDLYVERIEQVLGKAWHHHIEGKQLKRDSDDFRAKLKPAKLFSTWLQAQQEQLPHLQVKGPLFRVTSIGHGQLTLAVNFDRALVTLWKEARALARLDLKLPYTIVAVADEAKQNYPFAMRLEEVIRIYTRTCQRFDALPHVSALAAGLKRSMQESFLSGVKLQWLDKDVETYVPALGTQAVEFQDQIEELMTWMENSTVVLNAMKSHQSLEMNDSTAIIAKHINELQSVINHLDKRGYSNIDQFVVWLDSQVEATIVDRLKVMISAFTAALQHSTDSQHREQREEQKRKEDTDSLDDESSEKNENSNEINFTAAQVARFAELIFPSPIKHELMIRNQLLIVDPPLERARLSLTHAFHAWTGSLCQLPRLRLNDVIAANIARSSVAGSATVGSDLSDGTYRRAISAVPAPLLQACFVAMEAELSAASHYVSTWLQYQALWDMDIETVVTELGTNLPLWERLLVDMKRARAVFDTSEQSKSFGALSIEYGLIQSKVNNKYDQWHRNILAKFGARLGDLLNSLFTALRQGREQLEKHRFDFSSTADIVDGVTLLQSLKTKSVQWELDLKSQQSVENLLVRQRFHFPAEWLFADRVEGEWLAFQQILQRKLSKMNNEKPNIQARIGLEDQELERKIKDFNGEWKKSRPVSGAIGHKQVETILNVADANLAKLEHDSERLSLAKQALGMPGITPSDDSRLAPIREELNGLKTVWGHLSAAWNELDSISDKFFREIKPSEIRKQLTRLQGDVQKLPNSMRSYEAYEHLRDTIKVRLNLNSSLVELHSGVLRPKHEKMILKELGLNIMWNELTVGQLWGADLKAHTKALQAILTAAQGESALEEFLNELREEWDNTRFELVDYKQGKSSLIRNWDALFAQLTDRLSDLNGMKQSPFFKTFEREALQWEAKLNSAQGILDCFIDVQRKWIYLEAIFTNSTDVQQQLQSQYKKFKAFDREFVRLMRDIAKEPAIDPWINEERQLQRELDSYAETLNTIQKALGEYLEKQRAAFPRFYFIGDEDLLEMIGNAKNPAKIQRHLTKMFAGIEALFVNDDSKLISGMLSKEGESVPFHTPIAFNDNISVHAWLTQVQYQMRYTLAALLEQSISEMNALELKHSGNVKDAAFVQSFFDWIDRYPAQIVLLSQQVQWSAQVDAALGGAQQSSKLDALSGVLAKVEHGLELLADRILFPSLTPDSRKKYEQLITEKVHQRDSVRSLIREKVNDRDNFEWLGQMRYYHKPYAGKPLGGANTADLAQLSELAASEDPPELKTLEVRISRASFFYGFEYLGVSERLVQTPLTDKCYLTLSEALHMRLGGNPFGPAGTGKTETVKALGNQLGRMTLVFNCDENFDFAAMGRIFIGLCQCGAWGCFDEFNRLEERILSAVSQQILTIQQGLKNDLQSVALMGKDVRLDPRVGLFVTMNPGYAGRSNLPDNLKQLFRSMAMIQPDRLLIAQVMLYSQGFRTAEALSSKVVLFFQLCQDQLSARSHYDFGLRALKAVLRSAGGLKRSQLTNVDHRTEKEKDEEKQKESAEQAQKSQADGHLDTVVAESSVTEEALLVRSIVSTIVPKLVSADVTLFATLTRAVFPGSPISLPQLPKLREAISAICEETGLVDSEAWIDKLMQLNDISQLNHGVILVGGSGTGKSSTWNVLKAAKERIDGTKISVYVIDPKSLSKHELFGFMDDVTMEFTDGVFTAILRRIIDNVRGEMARQHWIVFDGDVDPEWAENLNSVLDDNKLLTLPNGERLALTSNVRILFEVANLNHATPATVSRCGMIWFSDEVVSVPMICRNLLTKLANEPMNHAAVKPTVYQRWKHVQQRCADLIGGLIGFTVIDKQSNAVVNTNAALTTDSNNFVLAALDYSNNQPHIMPASSLRALASLFSLFKGAIAKVIEFDDNHADFPLNDKQLEAYLSRFVVFAVLWSFGGSMSLSNRLKFAEELVQITPPSLPLPPEGELKVTSLLDWEIRIDSQSWERWDDRVESVELDAHKVVRADVVIDTVDTARHTDVIASWVADHRPLLLCGPPGSGKSMTLTAVLRSLPEFELVTLNFSSTTTPKLLLDTLSHHCRVDRTPNGLVMHPNNPNKWLVLFCDEINLPANDAYQTQHVITWLRQVSEHGGFWRASDLSFVRLDRVQILGACNPPTDAGRVPLTPRFLRHCPLIFVDFPAQPSLKQIYGTFNRALLKLVPSLKSYWEPLTDAMIEVYAKSQARFTPEDQPHYIYSPRELSRWVRALYEALKPPTDGGGAAAPSVGLSELVRLWAHEALRLFSDRLVERRECEWTDATIDAAARRHFPSADLKTALARPILFSNWLTRHYTSVAQSALREHVNSRLRVFNEEELDVKLVIFDEVLEHILRIDRVLRQPLGHLLLVGASGAGKTILSKFVAWMNGMSVFQIKVHKFYTGKDFDKDLRNVLMRSGCKGENICFIFDESNVLNTAFLERMNALLAGGEVPGLFEGQDHVALINECREAARRDNLLLDTEEELFRHFISEVQRRLHVVFTMNPSNEDFDNRSATSPALFNRCVIDWFGEWSTQALYQVGYEFTKNLDLGDGVVIEQFDHQEQSESSQSNTSFHRAPTSARDAVVKTLVYVHESVGRANALLAASTNGRSSYVTPRHYLDFLKHYASLFHSKRAALEEQQRHLKTGLRKLHETQEEVAKLQVALREKEVTLRANEKLANEKLEQMMIDKREAEEKRDVSVKIAAEMESQTKEIQERQSKVETELASAKPALDEAESAVRNIKKVDLDQVSRYPNPPPAVKLALEAVVLMLGENTKEWEEIRKILRRSDFIKSVINYDITQLSKKTRDEIQTKYLPDPNFAYDVVYNASKACGPLVQWVGSTINFSRIKNSVAPLEEEMRGLADKQTEMKLKLDELTKMQKELEERIAHYKVEYSALIGEVEKIKREMSTVQVKVDRSMSLLTNLSAERDRWQRDSDSFQTQLSTVVGDCLLSSAFLAYIGYFHADYRSLLVESWRDQLESVKVATKLDLNLIEYLSHPSERLEWQSNSLPADDLCTENAIMIANFNRYPLIIDPSGQAISFLMKQFNKAKILRTSFLDEAFLKHLESALRFGNALLVEDVESIDPILNSVLNREITKTGGRVMITLGDKEIDFSPSFTIFLSTRDPSCHFTPDLCSRVTLINFTVTHSSLTSQSLSKILASERPDIDAKRSDLLKLQGEFRVRLRQLEDSVLTSLAEQRGNILDDTQVMDSLETLKKEAAEVSVKMSQSDAVMEEITAIGNLYRPFAESCSALYFTLESLSGVHFLYQFSLPFFLQVVDSCLTPRNAADGIEELSSVTEKMLRLAILSKHLLYRTYARTSRALLNEDQTAFGIRLIQIALEEAKLFGGRGFDKAEFEFLMTGAVASVGASKKAGAVKPATAETASNSDARLPTVPASLSLTRSQRLQLSELINLPAFGSLLSHINANAGQWMEYIRATDDDDSKAAPSQEDEEALAAVNLPHHRQAPSGWESAQHAAMPAHVKTLRQILIAKILRPDRVPSMCQELINRVFGQQLSALAASIDLANIVDNEVTASTPLLLISKPGFDASSKVDALAATRSQQKYFAFAMGSPEGFDQADAAIASAVKLGHWVLLKNVHLSPQWLTQLEKRLHRMHYHANFRLFLSMELNPSVPVNLLRMASKIVFEPPVGVKASLRRMFASLPSERVNRAPAERSRLYFLLSWLHAIIVERLRYTPVGWAKPFEFSETDAACAMDAIDEWIDTVSKGRANISPAIIPWSALRSTLEAVIYGGRIDNEFDSARLAAFVETFFTPRAYDLDFPLTATIKIPDINGFEAFKQFIETLDDDTAPTTLGLPDNAERLTLQHQAEHIATQLIQLQDHHRESENVGIGNPITEAMMTEELLATNKADATSEALTANQPTWMAPLLVRFQSWMSLMPDTRAFLASNLTEINKTNKATQVAHFENPLFRCIQREHTIYAQLLDTVRADLSACVDVLTGVTKANHRVREILNEARFDRLPRSWRHSYTSALGDGNSRSELWIEDYIRRLNQIMKLAALEPKYYASTKIWLGGFAAPEAFIAAIRQFTATTQHWPLEQLQLKLIIDDANASTATNNPLEFQFDGFDLHCACYEQQHLTFHANDPLQAKLPAVRLAWILPSLKGEEDLSSGEFVTVPVYLDQSRAKLLFSVRLRKQSMGAKAAAANLDAVFSERGTAITIWNGE